MSTQTLKVVIPMAGFGTRLRPHTWSKPKQLVSVAGKTVLDHLIDGLGSIPGNFDVELINIIGYLGDQIEEHLVEKHPDTKAVYVVQEDPRGQSHAIQLASDYLEGPMLMVFADTLLETDLSFLSTERADAVAWVKPVPDPRRFGVAIVDGKGWVTHLVEKPKDKKNNLAVVGFYYFREARDLLEAIDQQMQRDIQIKGEYFLTDAINLMLEVGLKMRTERVDVWLDGGTPDALLETNRYLLANGHDNSQDAANQPDVVINPPVFIHPTANVTQSIIGPNTSIGAGCEIEQSIIKDSILEDQVLTRDVILEDSLVGRRAQLKGQAGRFNVGDDSSITR